ncbi:helix-turn-helix domain-containing protein [Streptomyces prunicolor]|uniref:helix-turn-helix domain-containing protein n=1 Tax=Streptomyces prunicolor TaxID=67348 RepID=UPI00372132C4
MGWLPDGTAFAVVTRGEVDALHEVWPFVAAGEAAVPLYGGTGASVDAAKELNGALAEARYALASARSTAAADGSALTDASALTGLDALLAGVPAEALHLHVNSVRYRIGRSEHFTGRDLSRLYDRLDLWAALLCRTDAA